MADRRLQEGEQEMNWEETVEGIVTIVALYAMAFKLMTMTDFLLVLILVAIRDLERNKK